MSKMLDCALLLLVIEYLLQQVIATFISVNNVDTSLWLCKHLQTDWDQLFITETGLLASLWTESSTERHTFITWNHVCACVCVCKQRRRCVCVASLHHPLHTPVDKWEGERATPTCLPGPVNCVHSKYFHSRLSHGNEGGSRTETHRDGEMRFSTDRRILYVFERTVTLTDVHA